MRLLKVLLFSFSFLFIIIFSVLNTKFAIIGGKFLNQEKFFFQTTKCKIYSDSTFELSYISSLKNYGETNKHFFKGKISLKNDTIYLKSKEFNSRVVLKNNEMEFLDDWKFKLPLDKNRSSIVTKNYTKNKDYSCFSSFIRIEDKKEKLKVIDLNESQLNLLDNILNNEKRFDDRKNQNYNKQYGSYIDERGNIRIYLFGISKSFKSSFNDWRYFLVSVHDGGKGFFRAEVNLTNREIVFFHFHGMA